MTSACPNCGHVARDRDNWLETVAAENERLRSALQFVLAFNAECVPVPNGVLAVVEAALAGEGS